MRPSIKRDRSLRFSISLMIKYLFIFILDGIYFYFYYVQLAIGGRGHVTKHVRESTVHNQNKNNSRESETNTD